MNLCSVTMPLGLNQDCLTVLQRAEQFLIIEKGTAFTTANLPAKSDLVTAIQQNLKAYVIKATGYNVNTPDPTEEETPFGQVLITNEAPPRVQMFADLNPCDYRNLLKTLKGGLYQIIPITKDGNLMVWNSGTSSYGFTARLYAINKGLPDPSALHQFYDIRMYFTNVEEFKEFSIVQTVYNPLTELLAVMPNGLGMKVNSYDGTTAVVYVGDRCADAKTGLVVGDFELVETNSSATITAATDNSDGTYDLSISLSAGEYAIIRVKVLSGSDVTDISWNVQIEA